MTMRHSSYQIKRVNEKISLAMGIKKVEADMRQARTGWWKTWATNVEVGQGSLETSAIRRICGQQ